MIKKNYDVIIIGGGPVGAALAIELSLQNVSTLILEKHAEPLKTPRAQSLSARTMEFFMRWGIDKRLEEKLLLPKDLPQTGIWCSSLTGEAYFESLWGDNQLADQASPKEGVRVPLWVTEEVLRERLQDFPHANFLKNHEAINVNFVNDQFIVESYDKINNQSIEFSSQYLACCDGASGFSKEKFNNTFQVLSDKTKMLGTIFTAKEMMKRKTVPDGIMYFIISDSAMAFVGPIDLEAGSWLAQIIWNDSLSPDEATLSTLIDNIMGHPIEKTVEDFYFWEMQVKVADFFSYKNRAFWLGDAAHAFAPTGGLGLNTGFGDAQNLGWKLGAVIKQKAPSSLLLTYEKERRPICMNNLNFAKNNAEEFMDVKRKFPPQDDYRAFALAYADLGNRYLSSSGLTLGYGYFDSPLTQLIASQSTELTPFEYIPKCEPGYFLPHLLYHGLSIYTELSPTEWNLIICGKANVDPDSIIKKHFPHKVKIVLVHEKAYPYAYLLIRPDWHVANVSDCLQTLLKEYDTFLSEPVSI